MVGWLALAVRFAVVVVVAIIALRRASRWSDSSLDSQTKQSEAFLWYQRSGSGSCGAKADHR